MILLLLAAEAAAPSAAAARFEACAALAESDPAAALTEAGRWRVERGGSLARQCEGLAYAAQERWAPAQVAFEAAAREAEAQRDGRAASLWIQTGNAALAANAPAKAIAAFDAALATGALEGAAAGETHLDRARAAVAANDPKAARRDLDEALKLVPEDPLAWLLSATLARRAGDLDRAHKDIAEAATRSPDDASVALEAGNIALLMGAEDAARVAWAGAVKNAPDSPAGKSAAAALARLGDAPKP